MNVCFASNVPKRARNISLISRQTKKKANSNNASNGVVYEVKNKWEQFEILQEPSHSPLGLLVNTQSFVDSI